VKTLIHPLLNAGSMLEQWAYNSPEILFLLLEKFPVSCILCSDRLDIQYINPTAEKTFDFSLKEVSGKPIKDTIIALDWHSKFEAGLARLEKFSEIKGLGITCQARDGALVECEWKIISLRDQHGDSIGILCMIQDLTDQKRAEAGLRRQLAHMNALHVIDEAIAGSMDIEMILRLILNQVASQLEVDAAFVLLYDPNEKVLRYASGQGFITNALQHTRLPIGEGYAGRAAATRQMEYIGDLRSRKTDFLRSPAFALEGFVSYFAVPLIAKDEIKGVLEIFHRSRLEPDTEWLGFLQTLAGQTAIAIDNATLYKGLQLSNIELSIAYDATIEGWSHALDLRDKETEGHTQRVTEITMRLASKMNISEHQLLHIRRGALLHDIGKMGVPDQILLKPGPLTEEEWAVMKKHPQYAYEMLEPIQFLRPALEIPYAHHEKWNGTGYPRGLKDVEIPLAARIFAVVDVYDALLSDRPYRPPWTHSQAVEYIRGQANLHFDAQVVDAFLGIIKP